MGLCACVQDGRWGGFIKKRHQSCFFIFSIMSCRESVIPISKNTRFTMPRANSFSVRKIIDKVLEENVWYLSYQATGYYHRKDLTVDEIVRYLTKCQGWHEFTTPYVKEVFFYSEPDHISCYVTSNIPTIAVVAHLLLVMLSHRMGYSFGKIDFYYPMKDDDMYTYTATCGFFCEIKYH